MTLAYLPQKAWLLNATLRENVLFGEKFDSARYQRAVQACCLEQDIEQLPAGELTEIGEKVPVDYNIFSDREHSLYVRI